MNTRIPTLIAAAGLLALGGFARAQAPVVGPTDVATPATPTAAIGPIKGDLVIDFQGAVRGYVEPCG